MLGISASLTIDYSNGATKTFHLKDLSGPHPPEHPQGLELDAWAVLSAAAQSLPGIVIEGPDGFDRAGRRIGGPLAVDGIDAGDGKWALWVNGVEAVDIRAYEPKATTGGEPTVHNGDHLLLKRVLEHRDG